MSGMADIFGLAMVHEAALQKLTTLAVEYQGKHLTQERFCTRVIEILMDHQAALTELGKRHPAAAHEQGSKK